MRMLLVLVLCLASAPAPAQGIDMRRGPTFVPPSGIPDPPPGVDCDCVGQGRRWPQGEEICLDGEVHVCAKDQNVPIWQPTRRSCRISRG